LTAGHSKGEVTELCKALLETLASENWACPCKSFNSLTQRLNSGFKDSSSSNTAINFCDGRMTGK